MTEISALVLPFFGLILLGYIAGRLGRLPEAGLAWFNVFIVYLALPALFFKLLAETPIEELTRWDFVAVNVGTTFAVFSLVVLLAVRRSGLAEATMQGFAGAYGNIGYMGPGIAILALGERAAVPVALIFCFENMMHFTLAPCLMAMAKGNGASPHRIAADIVKKIVLHPFIIATALGVVAAWSGVSPPAPVGRLIDYLAQAAAPSALFVMGVTLALRPLKRRPRELIYLAPIKLIGLPILMYLSLSLLGDFDPVWIATAVLLAGLPTATNVFVIAQQYDVWVERASAAILVTTTLSVVTVSLILLMLVGGGSPAELLP